MDFPAESFDYVMAFHVLSVVPDPHLAMHEMVRVCKPDGQVVVVNHFRSRNRTLARFVDSLNPLTRRLGWRVDLQVDEVLHNMPVSVQRRKKLSQASIFTQLTLTKKSATVPLPHFESSSLFPPENFSTYMTGGYHLR